MLRVSISQAYTFKFSYKTIHSISTFCINSQWYLGSISCLESHRKKKWFITFIDDHTRVCWVYLLKEKSKSAKTFKDFHSIIENQYNTNIQIFHTDNGKEYFNFILGEFFFTKGNHAPKYMYKYPSTKRYCWKKKSPSPWSSQISHV